MAFTTPLFSTNTNTFSTAPAHQHQHRPTDRPGMGGWQTKQQQQASSCSEVKMLRDKIKILQHKLDEMMRLRETESQLHDQEMMVHALKESEWKQHTKWLQREVKRLNKVAADENRRRRLQRETVQVDRDEAVEKWKRLYLAIKIELDNLIHQGETGHGCWGDDELRREVRAKDETIQLLQAHIASIQQQQQRKEREVDILRQSLRIMTHTNKPKHLQH